MKFATRFLFPLAAFVFLASGCGGHGRALVVRSTPAEADVCIKGKANSERFSNQKSCIGTTPYEGTKAVVTDPDGKRKEVKFADVEGDHESFYVVVSRNGYLSEVLDVPDKAGEWSFDVSMKTEQAAAAAQLAAVTASTAAPAAPVAAPVPVRQASAPAPAVELGTVRVTSEPLGALVYIGGQLRGNTPFTYEGHGGENVMIRLELDGYKPLEKSFTLESLKNFVINFKMQSTAAPAVSAPSAPAAVSAPANKK